MKALILHEHGIEGGIYNEKHTFRRYYKSNQLAINDTQIYSFKCRFCDDFFNEYNSNNPNYPFYNFDKYDKYLNFCVSSSKKVIKMNLNEFYQFDGLILIGTKKEIISFIKEKYNSLEKKYNDLKQSTYLDNKKKEKKIEQIRNELEKEQSEKIIIKNQLDTINKKNKDISDDLNNEKLITSRIKSEIEEVKIEKQNLIQINDNLSKDLENEKKKNNSLKYQLDIISSEKNQKIERVSKQLENEKNLKAKLESKLQLLQKKENEQNIKIEELIEELEDKKKKNKNLVDSNKVFTYTIEELKQKINIKEREIIEINNLLKKEKKNNDNITKNLKSEQYKNQKLNDKLDNISIENNKNIKVILEDLQNEKKKKNDLQSRYSELQRKENQNSIKNKELEKSLQKKEEEINTIKKEYIPENYGLKFQSDQKSGDYDIVLDINSFKSLINEGWPIHYNKESGKEQYLNKKDKPTIVVGVIGNGNKGKSFFLEKLSGYDIPKGFNVKTIGLSIRYGTTEDHNVAILDSAGQETPLLKNLKDKKDKTEENNETPKGNLEDKANSSIKENVEENNKDLNKDDEKIEQSKKEQKLEDEDFEFEQYSRDKLITEFFLQKFIIYKSDILILVVGNITLTEQKLLSRVKNEVESMDKNKIIYVVHNLKDYSTEEQVNDYIENTLKKLYKIEIEEIIRQNLRKDSNYDKDCFNKYFVENNKKVMHFIFVNEFSEKAEYYNKPTINYIKSEIESIKTRNTFSILDDCKKFLVKISEEIMEENPKVENLIFVEDDKNDKIVLRNLKEITLKKFVVDEMGYTLNNDTSNPKYSYYINTEDRNLYINIELPGGGSICPRVEVALGYYIFIYEGVKKGDSAIEEDKKNEISKLLYKKNLRKSNKFKIEIKIPTSVIQVQLQNGEDLNDVGDCTNDGKGVYTFKYKVLILGQKNDKVKRQKKLEL